MRSLSMSDKDREIRERNLKHYEKESENLPKINGRDLTEDEQSELQKLESKYGKVVVKTKDQENEAGGGVGSKAELVLDIIKKHHGKLFVDEYQNPHIAISVSGHLETLPLRSRRFRNWLANIFYKHEENPAENTGSGRSDGSDDNLHTKITSDNVESKLQPKIYWSGFARRWFCQDCKSSGDRPFMEVHGCSQNKLESNKRSCKPVKDSWVNEYDDLQLCLQ